MSFDLNLIALIMGIVVACLTAISVLISIATRLKNNGKKRREEREELATLEEEKDALVEKVTEKDADLKSLNRLSELIKSIIPTAITIAEESGLTSGPAKLSFALSKIALWCVENDIDFKSQKDIIVKEVEKLISFSKNVNAKDKG